MGGGKNSDEVAIWPSADVGFMDPKVGVKVLYGIERDDDPEEFEKRAKEIEQDSGAWGLAELYESTRRARSARNPEIPDRPPGDSSPTSHGRHRRASLVHLADQLRLSTVSKTDKKQRNVEMDLNLKGKRCLVTGASRGIGECAAEMLAAEGCEVTVLARRENLLNELADRIEAAGHKRPHIIVADVVKDDAPDTIRAAAYKAMGGVDILVNSAGGSRPT